MELLVDRDGELGRKSTALSTPSILATDKHPATQSMSAAQSILERRKAVGGLLTLFF